MKEERQEGYPVDPTLTSFHMMLAQATDNPVFEIILKRAHRGDCQAASGRRIPDLERLKEHVCLIGASTRR